MMNRSERLKAWWSNSENKAMMSKKHTKFPKDHPKKLAHFIWMQKRVKSGHSTSVWKRTPEGFANFLSCVGLIPKEMERPSLGRKNHSKGYSPNNCGWQEWLENTIEPTTRKSFKKRQSLMMKERWRNKTYRIDMRAKAIEEVKVRKRNSTGTFAKGPIS